MLTSRISTETGGRPSVKERGIRIATPLVGPIPGSAPTRVPTKAPHKAIVRLKGVMATAKPARSGAIASMAASDPIEPGPGRKRQAEQHVEDCVEHQSSAETGGHALGE